MRGLLGLQLAQPQRLRPLFFHSGLFLSIRTCNCLNLIIAPVLWTVPGAREISWDTNNRISQNLILENRGNTIRIFDAGRQGHCKILLHVVRGTKLTNNNIAILSQSNWDA